MGGTYKQYRCWVNIDETADADIEQAITEYLSKQEPEPLLHNRPFHVHFKSDCKQEQDNQEIKVGDVVWWCGELYTVEKWAFNEKTVAIILSLNRTAHHVSIQHLRKATPDEVLGYLTKEDKHGAWLYSEYDDCPVVPALYFTANNGTQEMRVIYENDIDGELAMSKVEQLGLIQIPHAWVKALWPDGNVPYPKARK